MTNTASALRPVRGDELEELRPLLAATAPALRLAAPLTVCGAGHPADQRRCALRSPDLVAELRQARAARFTDRYEWLTLRRRRAQIAARRAIGE